MNKKLLFLFVGVILAVPAFADDERGVATRMSCSEVRARIAEINAMDDPDDDALAELDDLTARERRDCTTRNKRGASGRAPSAAAKQIVDDASETPDETVAEPVVETVELDAATVKANLNAGLCADGTKPNKYGCCTDEVFRDMGGMNFACCPTSGGDCFPPITGK